MIVSTILVNLIVLLVTAQTRIIPAKNVGDINKLEPFRRKILQETLQMSSQLSNLTAYSDYNSGLRNEDIWLSVSELIVKYGYPLETYNVETEDGYILKLYRIPGTGPVVFLMHGLLGCADDFIVMGPDNGLAYLLSNAGYDVWLGNARGCKHSQRHITLGATEEKFWDFSWHENGYYDLPAMIDYVLLKANVTKLKYIGHSSGTTSFFVMASEKPEYNDKIDIMIAYAPAVFLSHSKAVLLRILAIFAPNIYATLDNIGVHQLFPDNAMNVAIRNFICNSNVFSEIVCDVSGFINMGFDFEQINLKQLPVLIAHTPTSTSTKVLSHYAQVMASGEFRHYDYGRSENMKRYGTRRPPKYYLENVSAPVALFYANNDFISNPIDVEKLYKTLNNVVDLYRIPFEKFNHFDYIYAKDVKTLVYVRTFKLLSQY